jgi:acetylornithine deacetylase/succinyl-diaminopimelate desuccinylase-like protein
MLINKRTLRLLTCILILLLWLPYSYARPDSSEPDWKQVEKELIPLLQKLIQTDSQNPPGNELAVCRVLKDFLDHEGIKNQIFRVAPGRANLVARLHGNGSQKAILLVAHTDVVPFDSTEWSVPPLSGVVKDGYLYGRGALDDKGMLAVEAMTLALLKRRNIPLSRDIIFLATAGEETGGGVGMGWLLEKDRKLAEAAFAYNEGGRIVLQGEQPLYIGIQTSEKAAYNIRLTARGTTGHSSVPRADNAIYALARALNRLESRPVQSTLNPVTRAFFIGIAPLDPKVMLVGENIETKDPLYLSMTTNTISPTLIEGGFKTNVHPASATVNLNCRLQPDQDLDNFVDSLRIWVGPGPYSFEYSAKSAAPPASAPAGAGFILLEQVSAEMFPGAPVLPYQSPGMSDGTRLRKAGVPTYGLLPFPLPEDEIWRMHGKDERISIKSLMTGMKLMYRVTALGGK